MRQITPHLHAAFSWLDYCLFIGALVCFVVMGGVFAFRGQKSKADALLGSRNMSVLPIALTVLSTFLSAISILGFPAEIYTYGTMMYYYAPMYCVAFPLVAWAYLPTLYNLQLTSIYQYLELRFSRTVRTTASIMFCAQTIFYMAVVLYAPAMALASVTPLPMSTSIMLTGVIATFYTSMGGATAVIYTSALQMLFIFVGMVAVIIVGLIDVGGFGRLFEIASQGQRIQYDDYRIDPTIRHSAFSLFVGGMFLIAALFGTSQMTAQRYIAMPTLKQAKRVLLLNIPFNIIAITMYLLIGLLMYATYQNDTIQCDPRQSGFISKNDQLLPYYVMDRLRHFYGIPGLFVASVYSAGLSTLSGGFNSLSAVIFEDFIRPIGGRHHDKAGRAAMFDRHATKIIRLIAITLGMITILSAFALSTAKSMILSLSLAIFGIFGGPILGVFTLGLYVPFANKVGALCGMLTSLLINLYIAFGAIFAGVQWVPLPLMPQIYLNDSQEMSRERYCQMSNTSLPILMSLPHDYNTVILPEAEHRSVISSVFKLSYQYYSMTGCLTVLVVGILVSLMTRTRDNSQTVPKILLAPILRERYGVDEEIAGRGRNGKGEEEVMVEMNEKS